MTTMTPERLAEIRAAATFQYEHDGMFLPRVALELIAALDERDAEIARLRAEVGALRVRVAEGFGPEMVSIIAGNTGDEDGAREWMQRAVRAAHD